MKKILSFFVGMLLYSISHAGTVVELNLTKTGGLFGLYGSVSGSETYDSESDVRIVTIKCSGLGFQRCRYDGTTAISVSPTSGGTLNVDINVFNEIIGRSEVASSTGELSGTYVKKVLVRDPETDVQRLLVYTGVWKSVDTAANGTIKITVRDYDPALFGY